MSIALERMNSVVHFIKNSPKKLNRFNNIVKDLEMDDNPHLHNIVLRPLCPTRWVMRLPAVDAFLAHYASILEFMDELKNDRTEHANNKEWAESYLRGLETFQNYFCLRIVQAVLWKVHPIHVQCQSRHTTAGEVRNWVGTLALSLSAEAINCTNAAELYVAAKFSALDDLHLDLPALPRVERVHGARTRAATQDPVTEEQIKVFYTGLYLAVMNVCSNALTDRYSANDLGIVELLRKSYKTPKCQMQI